MHSQSDPYCDELTITGIDGNKIEGGKDMKIGDILGEMKFKRNLIFAVVLNGKHKYTDLKSNYKKFSSSKKEDAAAVTLAECFEAFSEEETLTGNDQWYCKDCKEHRDIHKKLELYKVPKIMIIHLRRFRSKRSANSGESGFFNLAYAQIAQQEKAEDMVDYPLESLDVRQFVKTL